MPYKDYEKMREYQNKWAREKYAKDQEHREKYLTKKAKWRKDNKYNHSQPQDERRRAYDSVKYHLKKEPCQVCGTGDNLQAHHEDYSNKLDVMWLCAKHHKQLHRSIKEAK